jgi:hypothetical protein
VSASGDIAARSSIAMRDLVGPVDVVGAAGDQAQREGGVGVERLAAAARARPSSAGCSS